MRNIPFGKPILGQEESAAVLGVLESGILVHGPKTKEFEALFKEFTKAPHAVSVGSCTAGLHMAYLFLGLGPGDEVIVPAQTHVATVHAVEFCGATPVFVDAEPLTGNIDIEQIESKINSKTKAISVVHFLGIPVDMPKVCQIANKHGLFIVEDCALAIGTYIDGRHAGLFGDIGAYSFYPVKHMTTVEGGMIITNREDVAQSVTKKRAFGVDKVVGERKVPGVYDVLELGYNYRMNEVTAAVGVEQIKRVPGFLEQRERNFATLNKELEKIEEVQVLKTTDPGRLVSSNYCLSIVLAENKIAKRFEIIENLNKRGVGTSVYYPKPVPHFTYYREKYCYKEDSFKNAARISEGSIALSVGPHLNEEDMIYTAEQLKASLIV